MLLKSLGVCGCGAGVWLAGLPLVLGVPGLDLDELSRRIEAGEWGRARQEIARQLERQDLAFRERRALEFQLERMKRMRLDFNRTRAEVWREAREMVPGIEEGQFARWEEAGAVEHIVVDGERRYLERAAANVFRVHAEARAMKAASGGVLSGVPGYRRENLRAILSGAGRRGDGLAERKWFRVIYSVTVPVGAVPAGETIRAWLPYPQSGDRQAGVRLIRSEPALHVLSPPGAALGSIYLERKVRVGELTRFQVVFEYSAAGRHVAIDPARVEVFPGDPELTGHSGECPPHLVFDPELRRLSEVIVGAERHPFRIAQRLFRWVHSEIPWAGAREYSTLDSLTRYALERRHGDCGIQTMLFMSLCRLNGIPARWESGWTTGPDANLHDWCAIYLAPYGWVPVDVSYGWVPGGEGAEREFYLGGIDSYRLVVNTDYEQPLFPLKTHHRSERVDFQRGELEWRGGNLYFDEWEYHFAVEELAAEGSGQEPGAAGEPGE